MRGIRICNVERLLRPRDWSGRAPLGAEAAQPLPLKNRVRDSATIDSRDTEARLTMPSLQRLNPRSTASKTSQSVRLPADPGWVLGEEDRSDFG